jgi:hypothetical protein
MAGVVLVREANVAMRTNSDQKSRAYAPEVQKQGFGSPIIIDLDVHNLWD